MIDTVRVTLHAGGGGRLVVGEHDITDAVQTVTIHGGGDPASVTVELLARVVEVNGTPAVTLPEQTVEALRQLGWTPPADRPSCGHWVPGADDSVVIWTPTIDCRTCQAWAATARP